MASDPGEVDVTVAVADDHLQRFGEVAQRLRAAGLRVTGEQSHLGTFTGRIHSSRLGELGAVAGVQAVEQAGTFQLPPSDSDIQ
jgi:hypothetical protein